MWRIVITLDADMMNDIQKIKARYEKKLLLLPNVVGVGVGYKQIKGVLTKKLCLKVYVQQKMAAAKLQKKDIIPKKLSNIETDVEEVGKIKLCGKI